jgi:LacI family transcriptional regulator, galactose operon repressor
VEAARTTITDVARAAGVSVATVSKVINQRYGVASATVSRVQAVIDEMGYESSLVARSLRNHRTNVIGILVSDIEPFSAELLKGAAQAIKGTGYELVVYSAGGMAGDHVGWERRSLSRLSGTLIDGAILVTPTLVAASYAAPVVAIDPHTGGEGVPTVDSDNLHGAQLAVEHLIGLGHRRIGFLGGRSDLESARFRELGYRRALSEAGIEVDPDLVRLGLYEKSASQQPATEMLTMPDRATAIFAANDLSALATMEVALDLGLRVPEDVSVIGFDNIPESALTTPALTTIEQPIQLMGQRAIAMLIDLLRGVPVRTTHVTLPTRLVVRQTTGPAAGAVQESA